MNAKHSLAKNGISTSKLGVSTGWVGKGGMWFIFDKVIF